MNDIGRNAEEKAFYDALTKPRAVRDFYTNDILVEMTKELTDMFRKNRTIDWKKKESAKSGMRRLVKSLLKKYKYPPEESESAMEIVLRQCEEWSGNPLELNDSIDKRKSHYVIPYEDEYLQNVRGFDR